MATKKRGTLSQYAKSYPKNLQQQVAGQTGYMVPVDSTMHEFNDAEKDAYIKSMFGGQSPNPSGVIRNVGNRSMNVDTTNSIFPSNSMPLPKMNIDDLRGYGGGGGVSSDEYTGDNDQDVPGYVNPGGIKSTYATPSSTAPQGKPMSFGQAFAQARKSGVKEFSWNGKKFSTALKNDTPTKAPRANDEDHVYRPNTRNTTVPKANTPSIGDVTTRNESKYGPNTTQKQYDISPALRHSEVDRVMNMAKQKQAQTDAMDRITRQGFETPRTRFNYAGIDGAGVYMVNTGQMTPERFEEIVRERVKGNDIPFENKKINQTGYKVPAKKKGGLLKYVKGGMVKGYAKGGRVEKSALADNDPNKTNPDIAYVVRTGGGDYPVFYKDSKSAHDWRAEYAGHAQNGDARFKSTVTGLDYAISNGGGGSRRVAPTPQPPAPAPPQPTPVEPTPAPREKGWQESWGEGLETWGNRIARSGQGAYFAGKLLEKVPKTGKVGAAVTTGSYVAQGVGPIMRAVGQGLNPNKDVDYSELLMDLGLLAIATGAHKKIYGKGKDMLAKRGAAKSSASSTSPAQTTPVETVNAVVDQTGGKRNVAPRTTALLQGRGQTRQLPSGPSPRKALPAGQLGQRALPAGSPPPKQLGYTPQPNYSNPKYKARPLEGEEYDWSVQDGFRHGGGVHQMTARLKKSKSFKTNFNR
jgi:hypothetical protein